MGKGKTYELDTVRDLHEATNEFIWPTRPDFSGNSKYAFADVAIIYPTDNASICGEFHELKKRSVETGKRTNVMSGSSQGENGMDELRELVEMTPPWGTARVSVKFPHRELILLNADKLLAALESDGYLDAVGEPKKTRGANISMRKPGLDEWRSATAGDSDVKVILDAAEVPERDRTQ